MKRVTVSLALTLALLTPTSIHANNFGNLISGTINGLVVGGGAGNPVDDRAATFVTFDNGLQWYCVPRSDENYVMEAKFLSDAFYEGYVITVYRSNVTPPMCVGSGGGAGPLPLQIGGLQVYGQ